VLVTTGCNSSTKVNHAFRWQDICLNRLFSYNGFFRVSSPMPNYFLSCFVDKGHIRISVADDNPHRWLKCRNLDKAASPELRILFQAFSYSFHGSTSSTSKIVGSISADIRTKSTDFFRSSELSEFTLILLFLLSSTVAYVCFQIKNHLPRKAKYVIEAYEFYWNYS